MKVLIIGATHGNELLGTQLYARLLRTRSPLLEHVDFIVGNPRAFAANKRYIDSDLNRSYRSSDSSYEAKRARHIKQYIKNTKPDIVLDIHTTTCEQPSCLIVGSVNGENKRRYLGASHIDKILQVQPLGDILSLGDFVIGYEIPHRHVTNQTLDAIASDLQRFIDDERRYPDKNLFTMTGKIYKKDVSPTQVRTFTNFQMHSLGFVPIMVGEEAYKKQTDYLGFKASAPVSIQL